jgi:hypothetical protein
VKIYVVMGSTGEYSDHEEWPVKAFTTRVAAEELVLNASNFAREALRKVNGATWFWEKMCGLNPYDPEMKLDYTGTYYGILELDLEGV